VERIFCGQELIAGKTGENMQNFWEKLINELTGFQKKDNSLIGWEAVEVSRDSFQKLYVGDEKKGLVSHQEREVNEKSYSLKIYKNIQDKLSMDYPHARVMTEEIATVHHLGEPRNDGKGNPSVSPLTGGKEIACNDGKGRDAQVGRLYGEGNEEGNHPVRLATCGGRDITSIEGNGNFEITCNDELQHREITTVGIGEIELNPFEDAKKQIEEACQIARGSKNVYWELLKNTGQKYKEVLTADTKIWEDQEKVFCELESQACAEILAQQKVHVNTAELYVNRAIIKRLTGTGIFTEKKTSDIYFEIVMEKKGCVNDKEVNNVRTSVAAADLKIRDFIHSCAEETLSLGVTEEPKTSKNVSVIIHEDAISSLLAAVRDQLFCSMEFYKYPYLKSGDAVYCGELHGDRVNLVLDPFLSEMAESCAWTVDGAPSLSALVIKDSIVQAQIIDNRYGQYLKKEPNGISGNMVLAPGKVKSEDLYSMADEVLEIVSFSSLLVDEQRLTWSSEIKFAKLYKKGKLAALIKGGVVSGSIKDNLSDCVFSKEIAIVNFPGNQFASKKGYVGPKRMLVRKGVAVAGR